MPSTGQGQWALGHREPLNANERMKRDDDGLAVRARILDIYSRRGFDSIDPADLRGRFRWWGLYTQRRAGIDGGRTAVLEPEELEDEFFMLRVRIPGGQLSTAQLRVIADIATRYGRDVAAVASGDVGDDPQLCGGQLTTGNAPPEHEEFVFQLFGLEHRGAPAVDAGAPLRVEPPPPEPPAQVGGVDRVEAATGVDVEDARPDGEAVVVPLHPLVGVQRLAVTQGPLALPGRRHEKSCQLGILVRRRARRGLRPSDSTAERRMVSGRTDNPR